MRTAEKDRLNPPSAPGAEITVGGSHIRPPCQPESSHQEDKKKQARQEPSSHVPSTDPTRCAVHGNTLVSPVAAAGIMGMVGIVGMTVPSPAAAMTAGREEQGCAGQGDQQNDPFLHGDLLVFVSLAYLKGNLDATSSRS